MRIISGIHKGRVIRAPKNLPVRPTTDRAKEGLFNMLNNRVELTEVDVLDLFCGTGNISYEFASRGARSILSVDNHGKCAAFVHATFQQLNMDQGKVLKTDALQFVRSTSAQWDLIFADPPYTYDGYPELADAILDNRLLRTGGILVIEHPGDVDISKRPSFLETRKYGRVHFSLFGSEA